jgi:hypothetical protein
MQGERSGNVAVYSRALGSFSSSNKAGQLGCWAVAGRCRSENTFDVTQLGSESRGVSRLRPWRSKRCVEMENVTGARELTRTRPNPISRNGMARIECLTLAVARRPLDVRHWRRTRRNAEILERPGLTQVCEIS